MKFLNHEKRIFSTVKGNIDNLFVQDHHINFPYRLRSKNFCIFLISQKEETT